MITKLQITNYKCWVNEEMNLSPLTILAGGNAVGKSSIIQSLLLTKKVYENLRIGEIVLDDINGINLGLSKHVISKKNISEKIILKSTMDNDDVIEVNLVVGDEITQPYSLIIDNKDDLINEDNFFTKNFQYLNAERVGPRVSSDISTSSELSVGNRGENTIHTIHKADLLKKKVHENMHLSKLKRFSANCEEWLKKVIPGTQLDISYYEEVNRSSVKYKNELTQSDGYIPTATGFGITYVLPIIVSGLILSSNENGLLIIENPEAHLHPFGQSKIGSFLARLSSCGVQVIVETHSEHVINGARLELAKINETEKMQINFFQIKENSIKNEEISLTKNAELLEWPSGFFDQNKMDLRELLKLRSR